MNIAQHKDTKVQKALTNLLDALCTWERETGRRSLLILKEDDFQLRADSGKCIIPDDIPNSLVFGYDSPPDIRTLKRQCEHLLLEFSARKGQGLSVSEKHALEGIQATLTRMGSPALPLVMQKGRK